MSDFENIENYEDADQQSDVTGRHPGREIVCLIAGLGFGAGLALLLSPSTGEDVRYALSRGYRKAMKRLGRRGRDLRDRAEDLLEHAQDLREHAGDIRERGSRLLRFARRHD
jgi:hypothetical protein